LRALLVLIPLFGVNLMFDIYSTETDWHDILNTFLNALNGLAISLVAFYCNKTVIKFLLDSLKQLEIDSGFVRLSVSDYFRSHSVGCNHEHSQKSASIRFASIWKKTHCSIRLEIGIFTCSDSSCYAFIPQTVEIQ
jgi:hypothetical protein